MARRGWINTLLVIGIVGVFAVPVMWGMNTAGQPAGQTYPGSDSRAVAAVGSVDPGYHPWFAPVFAPGSKEVESGLFALQAALGAGVFGFALGRLSARRGLGERSLGRGPAPDPEVAPGRPRLGPTA